MHKNERRASHFNDHADGIDEMAESHNDIGDEIRVAKDQKMHRDMQKQNPYLRFGLGINGYFNLLESLIKTFTIMSIFAII